MGALKTETPMIPFPSLGDANNDLLVCFSHLRWNFVFQRPQHLLGRAARSFKVAYVEEPVREGRDRPHLRVEPTACGVEVITPVLPTDLSVLDESQVLRSLVNAFVEQHSRMRLLTWYYTPVALTFTMDLIPDLTVYDCMDELSAFKDARTDLHELEDRLFKVSDLVFTGGHSLYEAKRVRHPDVHKFPSSIDARHFARARAGSSCPDDVREITGPRIGYFGVIDERMDLSFVAAMADERPDWSFVMLGPVVKIDPASLPQRKNIHWIGGREYDQLPDYIGSWSVGFMPFALNESTRFISPTKTPEFLAAGCPVVSTAIKDVVTPYGDARLIEIAQDPLEAVACVERLMSMAKEPWQAAVDKHLDGNSWDETWLRMHKLIERRLLEQTAPLMLELPQSGGIHA